MSKKVVQINTVCNESTGKIMKAIQIEAEKKGYDTISLVGRRKIYSSPKCEKYGNFVSFWLHVAINTVFDKQGYGSYFVTRKMVKRLRQIKPDIIHLHNLHGYYLNLPVLFRYLKQEFDGQVFWTFHDCWPFTGHCPHFVKAECEKWKTECKQCPNKANYPISWVVDASKSNYNAKKKMFCSLKKLTILVPSNWMKSLVKQSFFADYQVEVVHNGVDLEVFSEKKNPKIRDKYHIDKDKKIILGVAGNWGGNKGLEDFAKLAEKIPESYCIVLVGITKQQRKRLPDSIICIEKTEDKEELAQIYSEAHIFMNPSLEESFSLVTIEAMACGIPAIVLDSSAVQELVDERCGRVLHKHDSDDYLRAIKEIEESEFEKDYIRKCAEKYPDSGMAQKIVELYARV